MAHVVMLVLRIEFQGDFQLGSLGHLDAFSQPKSSRMVAIDWLASPDRPTGGRVVVEGVPYLEWPLFKGG